MDRKAFCLLFLLVALTVVKQTEAAPHPKWKGWDNVENFGKRIYRVMLKTLPVVEGYAEILKELKKENAQRADN